MSIMPNPHLLEIYIETGFRKLKVLRGVQYV